MKRIVLLLTVISAAAVLALAVRVATSRSAARSGATGDGPAPADGKERELPAEAAGRGPSSTGEGRVAARALGKLESASEEIGVASDITGRIVKIFVDEGDIVQGGQPLAQLDETFYKARVEACDAAVRAAQARKDRLVAGARSEAIRRAQAVLEAAEASARIARERAERAQRLGQSGIFSKDETDWFQRESEAQDARVRAAREELALQEHETRPEDLAAAEAELEKVREELAAAKAELEKTVIRSPIPGTVVRRNLRIGEAVSSFQVEPVVTVADLTRLRIRAEVDEIDIGKVRLGQRASAESESVPGLSLQGRVARLGKTMGRKKVKSQDPNERQDVRIREVMIDLDSAVDLPLGLRLVVSFFDDGNEPKSLR